MPTYAEIVAAIEAGWDADAFTIPRMANQQVNETKVGGLWLFIDTQRENYIPATTGTTPKDRREQKWNMTLYCQSLANAITAKNLLRDLINAVSVTSGWWFVNFAEPIARSKWGRFFFECTEYKLLI